MSADADNTPLAAELRTILQEAASWASGKRLSLLDAYSYIDFNEQVPAAIKIDEMSRRLPQLLLADSRFPQEVLMLHSGNTGAVGFYPNFVGVPMICRLLRTRDVEGTIRWLENVLTTEAADGWSVTLLWYVSVDAPIALTDDIMIAPVASIPQSTHTHWVDNMPINAMYSPLLMHSSYPPSSALIRTIKIDPFLYNPEKQAETFTAGEQQSLLLDIALALTAVGPRPVVAVANWTTMKEPDLEDANSKQRWQHFSEIMPNMPMTLVSDPPLDPQAVSFVRKYLKLSHGPTRDKVNVALLRLNQALRRFSPGDAAIELSIAFEALTGDSQSTEMTHKVKVRSVRLLGGTADERRNNGAFIGKMYDLRSKLVHSGIAPSPYAFMSVSGQQLKVLEIVHHSADLCASLIARIVDLGTIPEWSTFDVAG